MDPLFGKWASLFFAGLFVLAARHKLSSLAAFRAVLRDYRLLPEKLVTPAAIAIALVESMTAAAWLATWTGVLATEVAGAATVAVLAAYSLAIAVNLLRGRRYVSCGCGLSGSGGEYLSWGLVLRNAFLVFVALLATSPAPSREIGAGGYMMLGAALLASILLYVAGSQILRNAGAIEVWRRPRD